MVNNIRNNTISEIDAKKDLNALNEIKNVEIIKYKKRTPGHKKLLNLFNNLSDIILTDKTFTANIHLDEDVLKTSFIFVFRRRLEDVLKTSWSTRICSP